MFSKENKQLGVVAHAYNSTTQKTEAGRSRVQGQPQHYIKDLSQRKE